MSCSVSLPLHSPALATFPSLFPLLTQNANTSTRMNNSTQSLPSYNPVGKTNHLKASQILLLYFMSQFPCPGGTVPPAGVPAGGR